MRDEHMERTACRLCWRNCDLLVKVEDGKAVDVRGSEESGRGPCAKGYALPEILDHDDRLTEPMVKDGEGWESVPWEDAISEIGGRLRDIEEEYGPEFVGFSLPNPRGLELAFVQRFASALGSPNVASPGNVCHMPRVLASNYTVGSPVLADEEVLPECVVVWGCDPSKTGGGTMPWEMIKSASDGGSTLIVIDPYRTNLASGADIWIRPRPGGDGALAMGMVKAIIGEGLQDEKFVTEWCDGFGRLRARVEEYEWEDLEELSWVNRSRMEEAAATYAEGSPANIQWGNGLEHHADSFQILRTISILRAITGNLDIEGGEVLQGKLPITRPGRFMLLGESPPRPEKAVGRRFKLATGSAFVPRHSVVESILEEEPYPLRAMLLLGTNPLLTFSDTGSTTRALRKLDFLVASELFMTPSAELADVVLPAATDFEYDDLGPYPPREGTIRPYPKIVDPPGECWPDIRIINELAKEMGLGEHFWEDTRAAIDLILEPARMDFDELRRERALKGGLEYRKYEEGGFNTPSGKVEIYSARLEELGYPPLPVLGKSPESSDEYPFIMTNYKSATYRHSAFRVVSSLRKIEPEPEAELNPEAAQEEGIEDGDWIVLESERGRIRQRASFNEDIDPRVVFASYGWWYPEKEGKGWMESNVNVLTDNSSPEESPIGSINLRGIPIKIYPE